MNVTVARGFEVLSNGKLLSTKENSDKTVTFHWLQDKPHVSYLVTLVVGKFEIVKEDWRVNQPILLGYAQSWALFRMLMQERPQAMKTYLAQLKSRRTPDYRLIDFRQAFGNDLTTLEQRYFAYMRELVKKE